ncbi:Xaa-Pro dipeptidase [Marinobacter caseinilyticus]|uniref:Xaa-Pro dipeptidase n=1 Tax=Marinobacter caseinilyticus TaxID=2692195 RepID=UPI0014093D5C|nr:Xaa-Pro dipeptidase [Marinobacter caseinilyticus]
MPDPSLLQAQLSHLQTLQARYDHILEAHGYDAVLISSGAAPLRYADDQSHHHQGFGPFLHWTGLVGIEHSWLLVRAGYKPQLWLHTPVDFWHASPSLPTEPWAAVMALHTCEQTDAPVVSGVGRLAVVGDPAQVHKVPGDQNPVALVQALDAARVHKTHYELACIDHANAAAAPGHLAAREAFLAGGSEFEISLAYQRATGQREADAPYHSIIGLNHHAGTLHYQHYEVPPPSVSRSLLIDAGYRYRGYCSDITRTTAAPGEGHFQALIDGVQQLQRRLCDAVAPGVAYADLHDKAHQGLAALLTASGLVTGLEDDAVVAEGISRAFFPHGLGHLLGIQVHDVAGKPYPSPEHAPFLRLTHTLEPGMVLTIEPGLYFIPSLLEPLMAGPLKGHINAALIEALQGCGGIRIEDNVAVTNTGARNLTRAHLPA